MTPLPPALLESLITVAVAVKADLQEMADTYDWCEADYGDDLERLREVLHEIAEASKP